MKTKVYIEEVPMLSAEESTSLSPESQEVVDIVGANKILEASHHLPGAHAKLLDSRGSSEYFWKQMFRKLT